MDRVERDRITKAIDGYRMSSFRKSVLLATLDIPEGQTRTYKDIAEMIGKPRAFRAVGTALKNNPLAPAIPCHRVVKSDSSIGNYTRMGRNASGAKESMLKSEGVDIRNGKVVWRSQSKSSRS